MKRTDLPPIPKLYKPAAITTPQGVETLRCYMAYVVKIHGYRAIYPFTFDDMFHDAYAFLLERVDEWNPELSNFDTWATEMLRYGWLYAVREMHWAKYRLIDKQHMIDGRRLTRFGLGPGGDPEENDVPDQSDDFANLLDDVELDQLLSQLRPRDRRMTELWIEGYSSAEIDEMIGTTPSIRTDARLRVAETLGLKRPPQTRKYEELSDEDKRLVLEQYAKLRSYKRVTDRLNVHHHAVGQVVREAARCEPRGTRDD